jgi:hypothetical protein
MPILLARLGLDLIWVKSHVSPAYLRAADGLKICQ